VGMPRHCDSGRVDLRLVFQQVQREMLSHLEVHRVLEHPIACGAATERGWIEMLNRYLPERYRASSAFVVDAEGNRSRQIDIAIYDRFYSPLLFSRESGLHVPAECVYAIFEVKQFVTRQMILDAGQKAASVRRLRRTSVAVPVVGGRRQQTRPRRILAGVLGVRSVWAGAGLAGNVAAALGALSEEQRLDLGCGLSPSAFGVTGMMLDGGGERRGRGRPPALGKKRRAAIRMSTAEETLIFFFIRLVELLRGLGNAPAADLMEYVRGMESFG